MADEPKFTPGPLNVVMDGTMTGVWAEIRQECVDPNEDNKPWERELGRTETAYVRRDDAYPADNTDAAGFRPFEEAPEQFQLTEDGEEAIANAHLWAASPKLYEALRINLEWVRAALKCTSWHWDADQHEAATQSLAEGEAALKKALGNIPGQ